MNVRLNSIIGGFPKLGVKEAGEQTQGKKGTGQCATLCAMWDTQ